MPKVEAGYLSAFWPLPIAHSLIEKLIRDFLENGRIKDEGTHHTLYRECIDYREFYKNQLDTNLLAS